MSEENNNIPNKDFQFISGKDFSSNPKYLETTNDQTLLKTDHQTLSTIYAGAKPELVYTSKGESAFTSWLDAKRIYQVGNFTLTANTIDGTGKGIYVSDGVDISAENKVNIPALSDERMPYLLWAFGGFACFFRSNSEQMMLYTYNNTTTDINVFVNSFQQDGGMNSFASTILGASQDQFYRSACENNTYLYFNGGKNTGRFMAWCRKSDFILDPYNTSIWTRKDMEDTDIEANGMPGAIGTSFSRYNILLSDTKVLYTNSGYSKICLYDIINDTTQYYDFGESIGENYIISKDYKDGKYNIVANARNTGNKYVVDEDLNLIDSYVDNEYNTIYYSRVGDSGDVFKMLKNKNAYSYGTFNKFKFNNEEPQELVLDGYKLELHDSNTEPEDLGCFTRQQIIHGRLYFRGGYTAGGSADPWSMSNNLFDLVSYPDMFEIEGNGVVDNQKKWWLEDPDA